MSMLAIVTRQSSARYSCDISALYAFFPSLPLKLPLRNWGGEPQITLLQRMKRDLCDGVGAGWISRRRMHVDVCMRLTMLVYRGDCETSVRRTRTR